jgi:pimeloyl-ACP methyl ester carboxylesterase
MMRRYDPRLTIEGTSGAAVVLVPGINGSGRLFYRQVPHLRTSYRVATYSLRDDADSLDELASDLGTVVRATAQPDQRAIIVGESFGGTVALTFALAHPDEVEALVIVNSFPYFEGQVRLVLARAGVMMVPWGATQFLRRLTAARLHSGLTPRAEVRRFMALTGDATRTGYANRLRLLRQYDIRSRLRDLQPPALFVAATRDHLLPSVAHARLMASLAPRSSLRVLDGQGHICLIAPGVDLAAIIGEWRAAMVNGEP